MRKNDISNMELVKEYPWLQIKDSGAILLDLLPSGLSWFSWLGDLDSIDNEIEGIDDATFRYVQALITNIEREYEYTSGNICMMCGRYKLRDRMVCNECADRM